MQLYRGARILYCYDSLWMWCTELAGGRTVDAYCVFLPGEPVSHVKDSAWLYQFMIQDFTFCHWGVTHHMNTNTLRDNWDTKYTNAQALVALLYFCLPNNNLMYIQYLWEMVLPSTQNTVGVCNRITLLIVYYITSGLVTILKVTDALYMSLIFLVLLLVSSSSILAFRHSFFLFLKCLLASHLTVFQLSTLLWLGPCNHCILACFPWPWWPTGNEICRSITITNSYIWLHVRFVGLITTVNTS